MSMIFQSYAIWPNMTVGENVGFGLQVRRLPRGEIDRRVDEILDVVQMRGLRGRYPAELSGGQQQRVALARAIVVEPEVLLLDEPLSNLDANLREEMRFEIRRLHDEFRITTVYVTHDQAEAMVTSDRIAVMNKGRIEQVDAPHVLYARPKTPLRRGLHRPHQFPRRQPAGQRGALRRLRSAAASRPRRRQRSRRSALLAAPAGHRPCHAEAERRTSGCGSRNRRAILPRRILGLSGEAARRCQAAARFDRSQRGFRDRQPRLAGDRSLGHGTGRIVVPRSARVRLMTAGPLARFTVLDLTRVRAGPTAVRYLADWGANCIKVEMPPGAGDMDMGGAAPRARLPEPASQQALDHAQPQGAGRPRRLHEAGREGRRGGRELPRRREVPPRHRLREPEEGEPAHHPGLDLGLRPGRALCRARGLRPDRPGHGRPDVGHRHAGQAARCAPASPWPTSARACTAPSAS